MTYHIESLSSVEKKIVISLNADELKDKKKEELLNEIIDDILIKEDFIPISPIAPLRETTPSSENKFYEVEFIFQVLPTLVLPNLSALNVTIPEPSLEHEALRLFKETITRRNSKLRPINENRTPHIGEVCIVSVDAFANNIKAEELSWNKRPIPLQEEEKNLTLIQYLLNMTKGETKTFLSEVSSYKNNTASVEFKITLNDIYEEIRPSDLELAQKLQLKSEKDLEKYILTSVMSDQMLRTKEEGKARLLDALLEEQDFEIPSYIIHIFENEYLAEALESGLRRLNFTDEAALQKEAFAAARTAARAHTFLLAFALHEKLEISEKEMDDYLKKVSVYNKQSIDSIKKHLYESGQISDIRERLLADKALELMYQKAKKNIVDMQGNPVSPPKFKAKQKQK